MNRKKHSLQNSEYNPKTLVFWMGVIILTVAFIIMLIVLIVGNSRKHSVSWIKHLIRNELFTESENTYYVFVYDSSKLNDSGKAERIVPVISHYARYAKDNKFEDYQMFCFDVDYVSHRDLKDINETAPNSTNNFDEFSVKPSDLPLIIIMDGNQISKTISSELKIEKELLEQIKDYDPDFNPDDFLYYNTPNLWQSLLPRKFQLFA